MNTVTCNSKCSSHKMRKKKMKKLTSFAFNYIHMWQRRTSCQEENAEWMRENVFNLPSDPSSRQRDTFISLLQSLTVSSIQSSFFRTGVPDWHNNSTNKISVTCKTLTQTQHHTTVPAPAYSANTCKGTSTSHVRHQLDVDWLRQTGWNKS